MSTKKKDRVENKKRKMAALATVIELNAKNRLPMAKTKPNLDERKYQAQTGIGDDQELFSIEANRKDHLKRQKKEDHELGNDEQTHKRPKTIVDSDKNEVVDMSCHITEEEYKHIRSKLKERKRLLSDAPKIQLLETGQRALLKNTQDKRTPMFLTDIQHLLMTTLLGHESPCPPDRWCLTQKFSKLTHSVVLIVEGMGLYHYLSNESKFEQANNIFQIRLEVLLPHPKEGLIMDKLAQVPLTTMQANELIKKYGSLESAIAMNQDSTNLFEIVFPIEPMEASQESKNNTSLLPPNDKFPRTKLLLSALQMVDEGYPMPLSGEMMSLVKDYVFTKEKYEPVSNKSPMFGIDCEMCTTTAGINELTRISIVNEKHEIVYESLVRPTNKIVNYLTQFSGITPELMATVTKDLKQVQKDVSELLPPDAILVGQSMQFDLHAMNMMHPYVIDSSVCFNLSGKRKLKSKLAKLSKVFLDEAIQESTEGHDSAEDSLASLKLVQKKLSQSFEFGDVILEEKRRIQMSLEKDECGLNNSTTTRASKCTKNSAIVSCGKLEQSTKQVIQQTEEVFNNKMKSINIFELDSNKSAVIKAREIALEHDLTIANVKIEEKDFAFDSLDSTIQKLDTWIDKLWKSVAHNGLFLVLMGGAKDCPNGLAKIAIKKNISLFDAKTVDAI